MATRKPAKRACEPRSYDASAIEVLEGLEAVRKRPGMFVGGTDDDAAHHLFSEVIDNSMDEAISGHADRIEVRFNRDFSVTVRDNGRGIPIDPHPKYPDKTGLEVIMCTLHAGGKFNGNTYQTSGGLHGVGVSVVNALAEELHVEVVRGRRRYEQTYVRGAPTGPLVDAGPTSNGTGTSVTFRPDPKIFGKWAQLNPARVMKMARSKAYLFSGVKIVWKSELEVDKVPQSAEFYFPNGLSDYLDESLKGSANFADTHFAGKIDFSERFNEQTIGSVEWAVNWALARDGFTRSYCNTVLTSDGGTHESGFWSAILKGVKAHGDMFSNKRAALIERRDVQSNGCAIISCFINEPQFVGQTKDRLATVEAQRLVEGSVRDRFDQWLASDPKTAGAIIDHMVTCAEHRIKRRKEKETARKSAVKKLRLPGKLVDCSSTNRENTELFIVEGDSAGGSAKMARDRATQALLPLRGKILNTRSASYAKLSSNKVINDLCLALGVEPGAKFKIDHLRYERVIIMTDADVDGAHIASLLMTFFYDQMPELITCGHLFLACPPLYRIKCGAECRYALDDNEKERILANGMSGKGKVDVSRFKGLGEMDARDLKNTTMNPESRKLIKIHIGKDERKDTEILVTNLMGRNAEPRFQFIQDNAQFAEYLDI